MMSIYPYLRQPYQVAPFRIHDINYFFVYTYITEKMSQSVKILKKKKKKKKKKNKRGYPGITTLTKHSLPKAPSQKNQKKKKKEFSRKLVLIQTYFINKNTFY